MHCYHRVKDRKVIYRNLFSFFWSAVIFFRTVGHFTVMHGPEADGDFVSDTNLRASLRKSSYSYGSYYFFKGNFHNKANEICIKTRSHTVNLKKNYG